VSISQVTLDTSFKEFVEEARGIRLADIRHGTALYRKLVKEFNRLKQTFIDSEEGEIRRQARMLLRQTEASLGSAVFAGIAHSWALGTIGLM
jgi:hypothetical protein